MYKRLSFVGIMLLTIAAPLAAGEYSKYSDDPANAHDPPIAKADARIA